MVKCKECIINTLFFIDDIPYLLRTVKKDGKYGCVNEELRLPIEINYNTIEELKEAYKERYYSF